VITAPLPIRGFVKRQDFVEMSLLESIHGVAVRPTPMMSPPRLPPTRSFSQAWRLDAVGGRHRRRARAGRGAADLRRRRVQKNQTDKFIVQQDALFAAAAGSEPDQRNPARVNLARFYMSRGMYPEAKGILDLALANPRPGPRNHLS